MTTTTETKAVWHSIDTATLNPEQTKFYNTYKDINTKAGEARKAFEKAFVAGYKAPEGYKLAVSHRFGLSVAVVKDDSPKGKASKAASLAQFLAERAAIGVAA